MNRLEYVPFVVSPYKPSLTTSRRDLFSLLYITLKYVLNCPFLHRVLESSWDSIHGMNSPSSAREPHLIPDMLSNTHLSPPVYRFITIPFLAHDPKAIEVVQVILESILLRREKTMRDGAGNLIVSLPEKQVRGDFFLAMSKQAPEA